MSWKIHTQPPGVGLERAATEARQVVGLLEADASFHRGADHLSREELAATRVLIAIEITAAGPAFFRALTAGILLVEVEEGRAVYEVQVEGAARGDDGTDLERPGQECKGVQLAL